MSGETREPLAVRFSRRLARAIVPASFWPVVDDELQEEMAERAELGWPRWRLSLWGSTQYVWAAIRVGLERLRSLNSNARPQKGARSSAWSLDFKQAIRGLRLRPATSLTVIVTLALAVGATTSVYSVVDGILLRPLPYPEPDRLVRVWQTYDAWKTSPNEGLRAVAEGFGPPAPIYRDWVAANTGFASLGAYRDASIDVQGADGLRVAVRGQRATSGLFEALDIAPLLGRPLLPEDDRAAAPAVAVLSESLWRERFGAGRNAIGDELILDDRPHTIIGVMPAGFHAPAEDLSDSGLPPGGPRLWTPLTEGIREGGTSVSVIGRLAPDVTLGLASQRLTAVHAGLVAAGRDDLGETGVRLESLLESVVGDARTTLWFLLGAVGLVLLVATVNVANMLTASGLTRRSEMALRAALGAGSGRLLRGLFVETAVLTALGGAGGMFVAWATLPVLVRFVPPTVPRVELVGVGMGVLLFGIAVTVVTAMLVGMAPAVFAARADPQEALRASSRSHTVGRVTGRFRSALVVAEVTLAFILLVGAGLLANSYTRLSSVERGFTTDGITVLRVVADRTANAEERDQFRTALRERLNTIPGVNASAMNVVPLSGFGAISPLSLARVGAEPEEISANVVVGLEGYMAVLGIPVVDGRGFDRGDTPESAPIVVVNETMARRYWPGGEPLGQRLRMVNETEFRQVVGVAADVRHELATNVEPTVFLPASQSGRATNDWILRIRGDVGPAIRGAREAVASVSPAASVRMVLVLDDVIADSVALPRARTLFVVGLAGLAAFLTLIGVYGVLSFSVAQRTKEMGIRMALGASARGVTAQVIRSGLKLTVAGIAIGLLVTWSVADVVGTFLFEISPRSPLTYLGVAVSVAIVSCLAAYLPARRAAAVDPAGVLNQT